MQNWLLPSFFEDILPEKAYRIEKIRESILKVFNSFGYLLVNPPLMEYTDSLITGTGTDLDLKTFKFVDQFSGKTLGIRADITPQIARIDSHILNKNNINRICYVGNVLHSIPSSTKRKREVIQIGAEIFGHKGIESDLEIQQILVDVLDKNFIKNVHIDLGNIALLKDLINKSGLNLKEEKILIEALQKKDFSDIAYILNKIPGDCRKKILDLPNLYGGVEILNYVKKNFNLNYQVKKSLKSLIKIYDFLSEKVFSIGFDLCDIKGYSYHNGIIFSVYSDKNIEPFAFGGRYDYIGRSFGRSRPATGITLDMLSLESISNISDKRKKIIAPFDINDKRLQKKIRELKSKGYIVETYFSKKELISLKVAFDKSLILRGGKWVLINNRDN